MKEWNPRIINSIEQFRNSTILDSLISGEIPALIIKNFYSKNDCEKLSNNTSDFSKYIHGETFLKKIGIFLSAYQNDKEAYFKDAVKSNEELSKIFIGKNPIEDIHSAICKISNLEEITTAKEDGKNYSKGIIRIWEIGDTGPLHRDNANFEVPNFHISKYENQLSCVLHLQAPESGGELVIYRQKWEKSDEKFREIGFGYTKKVLKENIDNAKIIAKQGDLVILNPKLFHEILPTIGIKKRITFGNFIGFNNSSKTAESWS